VFIASKRQGTIPSTLSQKLEKGKKQVKVEEEDHEIEKEFEIIQVDSDEENEEIISNLLLQEKNAQIIDLEENLDRARNVIHFYEMENKKMSAQQAIYEATTIKAQRETQRAQVRL